MQLSPSVVHFCPVFQIAVTLLLPALLLLCMYYQYFDVLVSISDNIIFTIIDIVLRYTYLCADRTALNFSQSS